MCSVQTWGSLGDPVPAPGAANGCLDLSMDDFTIGDTVQIIDGAMKHSVGTVVYLDEPREKYLVRVGGSMQDYYAAEQIVKFTG